MTTPEGEISAPLRPELDLLKRDVEGMRRAWGREVPTLQSIVETGGRKYELLVSLVQEYFLRAADYSDGIWLVLREELGIPFFPLMRSLYETHAALRFLANRSEGEQLREAQIAAAHSWYHARWQIRDGRKLDDGGQEVARIDANLLRIGAEIDAEIMSEAEGRESSFSWTGKSFKQLLEDFGMVSEYNITYSPLSNMTHGHNVLISVHVSEWTPEQFERRAATARAHLRSVRRLMQDILHLRFSDTEIDSFARGDVMEVRTPWVRVYVDRP